MVIVSSVFLPDPVQVSSRDHLESLCLNIIRLSPFVTLSQSSSIGKPFLSIEGNSKNVFYRISFLRGVYLDEVLASVPRDFDYSIDLKVN